MFLAGTALVGLARHQGNADAFPRANQDHVHDSIDIYTCVVLAPATAGPESTSTTIAAPGNPPGQFQPNPTDVRPDVLGIHTHGDGLIHIHPFTNSVAGHNATFGVFLDQVGISMTDSSLVLPGGPSFTEGVTSCADGTDGVVELAKWNRASDAAAGEKPNQIFISGFDNVRLGADEAYTIAFLPADAAVPAKPDVEARIANVSDLSQPTTTDGNEGQAGSG